MCATHPLPHVFPFMLSHFFLSKKKGKKKTSGWILLLLLPLYTSSIFGKRNIVHTSLLFTWKQISIMDTWFYLTSSQAVCLLQFHNMVNGGSDCSCFHYQMNYAENLLVIWKTAWWHFPSFLKMCKRKRHFHWLHLRFSSSSDFFCFKIVFTFSY